MKPFDADKPAGARPAIAFIDLQAQRRRLGQRIDDAIGRVLEHGQFIMGPEVGACENLLAEFCGAAHVVSCGSGTQALYLALLANGVGAGDAVFVPTFTFASTAEAVALLGATPVFVDILPEHFDMDPTSLEAALHSSREAGLRPAAVIPVDIFGQPADYDAIAPLAAQHGLFLLADAAQSFGASLHGRTVGTFADCTATSFYPSKPLGAYGDGGAIFTDDGDLAERLRSLRDHGIDPSRSEHRQIGVNGRLDTIQAAILIEKLRLFPDELKRRQRVAQRFEAALCDQVSVPRLRFGAVSSWAQYTLTIEGGLRDIVAAHLNQAGVPTAIHYARPLHLQPAYRDFPTAPGGLPVSEKIAEKVLSIPFHPYLDARTQNYITQVLREALVHAA